ncbi:MAG TPA: phosphotransferase, partial [Pyrinomonadaceae bacterium]|nr:phosphotransferase [Pyrinomonadaceae bacterium]
MSSVLQSTAPAFTDSARDRIAAYLHEKTGQSEGLVALTPDASTREYFRIPWQKATAVAAVYPERIDAEVHPYLDVTRLFLECGLPVPQVLDVDGDAGIIVQEDLGSRQLCQVFEEVSEDERDVLLERAIELIARIQAATQQAFARDSIASRLAFDEPKLSWEFNFFFEHYFGSYRKESLPETPA